MFTALQIGNFINIIANKGYYYKPHLIMNKEGVEKNKVNLDSRIWKYLNKAMWSVVNSKKGTGKNAYVEDNYTHIRGKTGTAQNPHGEDHSWFAGYATAKNLEKLSVVVMVENGGRGSGLASSIAKNLFSYFSLGNRN